MPLQSRLGLPQALWIGLWTPKTRKERKTFLVFLQLQLFKSLFELSIAHLGPFFG